MLTLIRSIVVHVIVAAGHVAAQTNFAVTSSPDIVFPGQPTQTALAQIAGSPDLDAIVLEQVLRVYDIAAGSTFATLPLPTDFKGFDVGDLDGDGDVDIAGVSSTWYTGLSGNVYIWLNNAGFSPTPATFFVQTASTRIFAHDMDADGDLDLVTSTTICFNDGTGSFPMTTSVAWHNSIVNWRPGDFDGDGDADLVGTYAGFVARLRREANGTYVRLPDFYPAQYVGPVFEVADMNGDGIDDLVGTGPLPEFTHFVHSELGSPTFMFTSAPGYRGRPIFVPDLALGDFDLDGDIDVAARNTMSWVLGSPVPIILVNDGQGGLAPAGGRLFAGLPSCPGRGIAAGDVDGDGVSELVVGLLSESPPMSPPTSSGIRVYRLDAAAPVPALVFDPLTPVSPYSGTTFSITDLRVRLADMTPAHGQSVLRTDPSDPDPLYFVARPTGFVPASARAAVPSFGPYTISFTTPTGESVALSVTPQATLFKFLGDDQFVAPGGGWEDALGAHLANQSAGARVWWMSSSPALGFIGVGSEPFTWTNSSGDTYLLLATCNVPGVYTVTANRVPYTMPVSLWETVTFTVTVTENGTTTFTSGAPAVLDWGIPSPVPVTVRIDDASGIPLVGETVHFAAFPQTAAAFSPLTAVTGPGGLASVSVTAAGSGSFTIRAASQRSQPATETMFTRRLFASSSPSGLLFTFVHEHPSVPIILVVDAPQSAPGYSTTPFGRLYSSLLDPAPTAAIVDGIGVFGPADPQMLTALDGTWTRMFTFPPQAQSWVAQIVSYDHAYAYPATYGLSNAAEFTH